MAIEWLPGWETIHLGDTHGNPVTGKVGLVKVGRQTKVGVKFWPGTKVGPSADPPDQTMDLMTISDCIASLNKVRRQIIANGEISP
jgi:hypothetical protein